MIAYLIVILIISSATIIMISNTSIIYDDIFFKVGIMMISKTYMMY